MVHRVYMPSVSEKRAWSSVTEARWEDLAENCKSHTATVSGRLNGYCVFNFVLLLIDVYLLVENLTCL